MSRFNGPYFGTPEWKPISQTRHAQLVALVMPDQEADKGDVVYLRGRQGLVVKSIIEYGYYCSGCRFPMHMGSKYEPVYGGLQEAIEAIHAHDMSHPTNAAECCMHSTQAVCICGNVLV